MHHSKVLLTLVPFLTLAIAFPHNQGPPPPKCHQGTVTLTVTAPPHTSTTTSTSSTSVPATPTPFSLIAARSASPIHLQSINANGQAFWIGKDTSSYCPTSVVTNCPAGTVTALEVEDGGSAMDVEVPGGQKVYVGPNGALGYTQAHSALIPAGSFTTGFVDTPGSAYGTFSFTGDGATGFVACPTTASGAPWQIFANIPGLVAPLGDKNACLGFDALAPSFTGFGAWQYT